MRRFVTGLLACSMLAGASSAMAQTADDVVVMRRTVAKPTKIRNAPPPMRPVPGADLSSYYWVVSGFYYPNPQCSPEAVASQLRGCVKSGEQVDDDLCPQPAPPTSMVVENYDGCSYGWNVVSAGEWSSTCSKNAVRPVTAECRRQDGEPADESFCNTASRPKEQKAAIDAGCEPGTDTSSWPKSPIESDYSWKVGEPGPWASTCSTSTYRPQSATCVFKDGTQVPSSECTGPAPETKIYGANLSGCTFSWGGGGQ